ncbi:hypothetical protein I7I53_08965 [Histoplasma capsulatum var. duboisii H88]|uniref:Uncharacterized protein n=1 Tax=Ajellomyces capsulatus (strain H88) TaxID=544711 RepID=A0A8A1L8S3_AJEC8|nr:hypothetical protein I7I53_08965 [Histoplasma capsulatum var. duboisii H88]
MYVTAIYQRTLFACDGTLSIYLVHSLFFPPPQIHWTKPLSRPDYLLLLRYLVISSFNESVHTCCESGKGISTDRIAP